MILKIVNFLKKYAAPLAVSLFTTYSIVWSLAEPLGLDPGSNLLFAIALISVAAFLLYLLLRLLIKYSTEITVLKTKIQELQSKESFCCVTSQSTPICPFGIASVTPTSETIRSSLEEVKKRFKWLGFSAFNVVHNNYDIFSSKKDVEFTFHVLNPENEKILDRANENHGDLRGKLSAKEMAENSSKLLYGVKHDYNAKVEINYHNQMPSFRIILVDDEKAYVSYYERGVDALRTPQIQLVNHDGVRFPIIKWFQSYIEAIKISEDCSKDA